MEMVQQVVRDQDEIDLFDLIDDIRSKWRWLLAGFVVCFGVAIVYALLVAPVYQTSVVLRDVTEAELLALNKPKLRDVFGGDVITPEKAFKEVRAQALSAAVAGDFYKVLVERNYPGLNDLIVDSSITPEQNFAVFSERLKHRDPGDKDTDVFLEITFDLENADLAAKVLNDFSEFVIESYREDKRSFVSMRISSQLESWRTDADEKRTQYFAQKQRTLFDLKEAAEVAASIKQDRPLYSGERVAVGATPPLYMMGEKVLRTQIKELEMRSTDGNEDAYIAGLPELLWKIKQVEESGIDWSLVHFIDFDQKAMAPRKAIKPRKALIAALGGVAGLMLGTIAALLAAAQARRKVRKAAEQAN